MSFREVKEGMDSFFGLMGLTVELVNVMRKEDELKKHHRAYLHVREEVAECANEATEVIGGILDSMQEIRELFCKHSSHVECQKIENLSLIHI